MSTPSDCIRSLRDHLLDRTCALHELIAFGVTCVSDGGLFVPSRLFLFRIYGCTLS